MTVQDFNDNAPTFDSDHYEFVFPWKEEDNNDFSRGGGGGKSGGGSSGHGGSSGGRGSYLNFSNRS